MSNKGESVILPSNAVFLVHKVGSSKPGREIQWETRSKTMRAAPDPTPLTTTAPSASKSVKAKSDAADGASWEFVSYTPRKDQQLARRPKDKRRRRNEGPTVSPKERSVVVPVRQQPKLSLTQNPAGGMFPDLPVTLVGHALLYINFYFHSIATDAYTLPCLLFNPAKRDWFPRMMQDEAWRCIILSLSASSLAAVTGNSSNYVDSHSLLDEALRQLKVRVASGALPSDQTLGAISCLSMWSNEQGNYDKAWIHAKGLAELVKLRGGFSKINEGMRSKLYRGVFDIAVDLDRPPLIEGLCNSPSTASLDSPWSEESGSSLSECRIPMSLFGIFQDVLQVSTTIGDAMTRNIKLDTTYLYETVFGLYNRLLNCQSDTMPSCDNSLRICLILYIKSIVSQDRLNVTSMNLVRKLQASIQGCLHSSAPLTRWKLFIGGLAATDGTSEQQWFIQRLATAVSESNMSGEDGWKSLQADLSDILWVKPIHETAGHKLWLQIEETRST
ncbi:transcriptional regulator family: Fungal Specific TF [Trichoderma aggressivum f. europaeum]|uniref:Transcriptional regulator family: Fungal Specific TF n=1 Tax=Trichoderma aggressivum f. europaeum TaxID=173218 RepID=A0AAE1M1C9_9HYPO|nr:transcriptional regulator family: Fungal Specific TF [Trichoderma aggressivum f. europaeum]